MEQNAKLKQIELDMLKAIVDICKKEDMRYFAVGGTALGAVRHNGFIPWDDDIDLGMPREDYERFLKLAPEKLPEHLFLQHLSTDAECPFNYIKIRDSRTTFVERNVKDLNINHGVFIDVFPLDGVAEGRISRWAFDVKNRLLSRSVSRIFNAEETKCSCKTKCVSFVAKVLYSDSYKALKKRELLYKKYSYCKSDTVANYCGAWGKKEIMPKDYFGNGVLHKFDGIEVVLPEKTDAYLTHIYGDYMTPPPIEKQVSHHNTVFFDMEKSYTEYMTGNK